MTGREAEALYNEIQSSYELAMKGEKISFAKRKRIHETVEDWFVNNVESFVTATDAEDD